MKENVQYQPASLHSLAWLFLKLGTIAFGGPAAHIAMMRHEVVQRHAWLTDAEFLDMLGAANLIPGPNSTEMAIHIGYRQAGWPGLLVAGICFILPATLIVLGLSWVYVTYQALPSIAGLLYGIKPVIMAVVLQAIAQLGKTAIKSRTLGLMVILAIVLSFLGLMEAIILFGGGLLFLGYRQWLSAGVHRVMVPLPLLVNPEWIMQPQVAIGVPGLWSLFWVFVKIGSVLFGSGYVLLAFLQSELVEKYGWLTQQQLLDAVVVGQITPGPVFTTATFVGYLVLGPSGAFWATIGIFLPAFFFVAVTAPWIAKLRNNAQAGLFLDGVNAAAVGLMAVVTAQLLGAAVMDLPTSLLFLISVILLLKYRINSAWLCLAGGAIGWWLRYWLI